MLGPFLRSRKNLLGLILGLAGVAVVAAGLVPVVAGVPLVACLYLAGVLIGPRDPGPDIKLDVTGNDAEIKAALETLLRQVQGRVPDDVLLRVQSIRDSILATLGDPNRAPGAATPGRSTADPNVYLIQQTALQYLPTALSAYIALPSRYTMRDLPGRKNAHQMLLSQLTLMDEKLSEVTDAILARDAGRLETYGRFIQEKFGSSALDLDKFDAASMAGEAAAAGTPATVAAPAVDLVQAAQASAAQVSAAQASAAPATQGAAQAATQAAATAAEAAPAAMPQPEATRREPADIAQDSAAREREAVQRAAERAQATAERLREAARVAQEERERAR